MADNESPSLERDPKLPSIGIVCALNIEIQPFLDRCLLFKTDKGNGFKYHGCEFRDQRICVAEGGAGMSRARQVTQGIIDAFQPRWILSVGLSGALVDGISSGDIVVGTGLTDERGEASLGVSLKFPADPARGLHAGKLCTVDHIVREPREKRELAATTGAVAVDMESLAVAKVCRDRQTRFLAIRAISDDVNTELPREVTAILGPKGTIRAGALVGSILKRPSSVKDLWAMREQAVVAAEHLSKFLGGVIEQLDER
ncbi:MAG: 5'-methylthioadenosine nucleosidase [Planctomycetaceae bacterium]|nr:5'-methylthioadenosine nucleosidase [Planctomycetaceae bacterium]